MERGGREGTGVREVIRVSESGWETGRLGEREGDREKEREGGGESEGERERVHKKDNSSLNEPNCSSFD